MMRRTRWVRRRRVGTCLLTVAAVVTGLLVAPDTASAAPVRSSKAPGADIYDLTSRFVVQHGLDRSDELEVRVGKATFSTSTVHVNRGASCDSYVWVLTLDRSFLSVHNDFLYPMCSVLDTVGLIDNLKHLAADSLVFVNSFADHSVGAKDPQRPLNLGGAMAYLGAPAADFDAINLGTTTFSLIGAPGASQGSAQYSSAGPDTAGANGPAAITGKLVPDVSALGERKYSVAHLDYATYDVTQTGAITINSKTYPAPDLPQGFGGYRVFVVDRNDLSTVVSDRVYDTHQKQLDLIRMERDLRHLRAEKKDSDIVFLTTLGADPTPKTALPRTVSLPRGCLLDKSLAFAETCTYLPVEGGGEQTFTAPATKVDGAYPSIEMTLQGGAGGQAFSGYKMHGGRGARIALTMPVGAAAPSGEPSGIRAGQKLYVEVGGDGESGGVHCGEAKGGWNGGARGGFSCAVAGYPGGGGGGATDVRTRPYADPPRPGDDPRLFVAAGGGGAGGAGDAPGYGARGGDGGDAGTVGQEGQATTVGASAGGPGGPGVLGGGGAPGRSDGARGYRGAGGHGAEPDSNRVLPRHVQSGGGGGGGGGVYGGGGGGRHAVDGTDGDFGGGGGGGGASLAPGTTATLSTAGPQATFRFLTTYGPTLGDVLREFGATPTYVEGISTSAPRYTLVGSPNPGANTSVNPFTVAEASPLTALSLPEKNRPDGALQGVLGRGVKNMRYGPVQSHAISRTYDVQGQPEGDSSVQYGLFDILAQRRTGVCLHGSACPAPDAVFPFRDKTADPGGVAALGALEAALCPPSADPESPSDCEKNPPDIRATYGSANTASDYSAVQQVPVPSGSGAYTAADFARVKAQILLELDDATRVHAQEDALDSVVAYIPDSVPAAGDEAIRALDKALTRVPVTDPNAAENAEDLFSLKIYSFIFEILEIVLVFAGLHGLAVLFGILAASFSFGLELADSKENGAVDENGEPEWKAEAHQLLKDVQTQLTATAQRQSEMFALVYGNWGMLGSYGTNLKADPVSWDATSKTEANALRAKLHSAAALATYREIMPLRYEVGETTAGHDTPSFCFTAHHAKHADCRLNGETSYRYATNPPDGATSGRYRYIEVASEEEVKKDGKTEEAGAIQLTPALRNSLVALGLNLPDLYLRWPLPRTAHVSIAAGSASR